MWQRMMRNLFVAGLPGLLLGVPGGASLDGGEPVPMWTGEDDSGSSLERMPAPVLLPPPVTPPPHDCLPPGIYQSPMGRYTLRVVPQSDRIGMPLHHRNFSGDCYGENYRLQKFDLSTHWGRSRQRWQQHSLGMERCWGKTFGKVPRGYLYDTTGHPMRSFFVPQPDDPALAYVPGSDTFMPSQTVIDYANYVYPPKLPRCEDCYPDAALKD